MSLSVVLGQRVPARTGVVLLARLRGTSGSLVTQATLSAIAYQASDLTLGTALGSGTFPLTSVFDQLIQGDPRWAQDSQSAPGPDGMWGYNFAAVLPASLFPLAALSAPDQLAGQQPAHRFQAGVAFTPLSGEPFRVVFSWQGLVTYA